MNKENVKLTVGQWYKFKGGKVKGTYGGHQFQIIQIGSVMAEFSPRLSGDEYPVSFKKNGNLHKEMIKICNHCKLEQCPTLK